MPTVCKIKLDAAEYRKELQAVIAETRAAAGKMSGASAKSDKSDKSAAVSQIRQVRQETDKAAQTTKTFGDNARKAFGNLRTEVLSGEKPLAQLRRGVLQLLNPWTMLTAAIGAAAAAAVACWDAMTVSAEEHLAKMNAVASASARAREEEANRTRTASEWLARLGEISRQETSNRAGMEETVTLLGLLQKEYGTLGAEIDRSTGKLTNFEAVQKRVQKQMQERSLKRLGDEQADLQQQMKAQYVVTRGNTLDASESKAKREIAGLDHVSGAARLDFFRGLRDKATTQSEIDGYTRLIELQERSNQLEKEKRELEQTGYSSRGEMIAAGRENTQRDVERRRRRRAFQMRQRDDEFADATDPDKKIQNRNRLIGIESDRQARLRKELEAAETALETARKSGNQREIDEAMRRKLELQEKLQKSQEAIYGWERQIAEVEKNRTERNRSLTEELQRQAAALLPPDRDQARDQAIADAEKTQGGKLSERERELVTQLSDITYGRKTAVPPSYGDLTISTNALTARGGFRSGAAGADISRSLADMQRQQQRTAEEAVQIRQILKELKDGT